MDLSAKEVVSVDPSIVSVRKTINSRERKGFLPWRVLRIELAVRENQPSKSLIYVMNGERKSVLDVSISQKSSLEKRD